MQAAQAAARKEMEGLAAKEAGIISAMKTTYWMAKEDIAMKKYPSLMELLQDQGCEAAKSLYIGDNACYTSRASGQEFQECCSDVIRQKNVDEIKSSGMFSVLIDESTDIAITKHMVVYIRIVDSDFVPHTLFFKNVTVDNPKSDASVLFEKLKKALEDEGLDLSQVFGFGSDGASVMTGNKTGVATRMKEENPHCVSIHCMAHRLNLASSQASKEIPYFKEVEKLLSDLYRFFGGSKSGNRKCELEEIQKILDDPLLSIKECHEIRWLAFFEAVRAVHSCWASLVTYFSKQKDSKSQSFLQGLTQYKFLAVIAILMDVLPAISQLVMVLQKSDLDIACVYPALDSLKKKIQNAKKGKTHFQEDLKDKLQQTKDSEGHTTELKYARLKEMKLKFGKSLTCTSKEIREMREKFCDRLCENLSKRFPSGSSDVASAFSVLCMRPLSFLSSEDREMFGNKEVKTLVNFYGKKATVGAKDSDPILNPDACMEEWSVLKQTVLANMYPRDSSKTLFMLLHQFHKETFPNMLVLFKLCLLMPYHTSDCERGFSAQNTIVTAKRSKMGERCLNCLMTIKCHMCSFQKFDYKLPLAAWKGMKNRRIFRK